jgi:hypothetical protein
MELSVVEKVNVADDNVLAIVVVADEKLISVNLVATVSIWVWTFDERVVKYCNLFKVSFDIVVLPLSVSMFPVIFKLDKLVVPVEIIKLFDASVPLSKAYIMGLLSLPKVILPVRKYKPKQDLFAELVPP